MAERTAVEQAAEELYGLAPGEFTRARDERAKALRKEDREAANAVKALRRPTLAAWAVNQLARRRRKELDALLRAGEELRAAQEELLAGGDRAVFQSAAAAERELVAGLADAAARLAAEEGEQPGPGFREKVAETLHAAALDEETADELRAGRLVREREAVGGFGAGADAPATAAAGSAPAPKSRKPTERKPKEQEPKEDAREQAARQRLAAVQSDERQARRELDAATRAVAKAAERAEAARVRAEAAKAHAEETVAKAAEAAEREHGARRAESAARRALTRAERALAAADGAP